MGPRPFSRGKLPLACLGMRRAQSLQWGRDLSVAESIMNAISAMPPTRLQWGRDLSVAESWIAVWRLSPRPTWLQWGRDLSVAERANRRPAAPPACACFNGAATFQSRKGRPATRSRILPVTLQWGRDLSVAESTPPNPPRPSRAKLQWGRDLSVAERILWPPAAKPSDRLQWGRDLSVAERGSDRFILLHTGGLQWGRDLSVAESPHSAKKQAVAEESFNGAATFQSRKAGTYPVRHTGDARRFNGAATFQSRKAAFRLASSSLPRLASMGPRPFSRGKELSRHPFWCSMRASMGPRPFSRGKPVLATRFGARPPDVFCERCGVSRPCGPCENSLGFLNPYTVRTWRLRAVPGISPSPGRSRGISRPIEETGASRQIGLDSLPRRSFVFKMPTGDGARWLGLERQRTNKLSKTAGRRVSPEGTSTRPAVIPAASALPLTWHRTLVSRTMLTGS